MHNLFTEQKRTETGVGHWRRDDDVRRLRHDVICWRV